LNSYNLICFYAGAAIDRAAAAVRSGAATNPGLAGAAAALDQAAERIPLLPRRAGPKAPAPAPALAPKAAAAINPIQQVASTLRIPGNILAEQKDTAAPQDKDAPEVTATVTAEGEKEEASSKPLAISESGSFPFL
jgi:hypothetical protein